MIASQDLSIRVCKGMFGHAEHYMIGDAVTVLTKDNNVHKGVIDSINQTNFNLLNENEDKVLIHYNDMRDIADSEWLGDEDIRSS